MDSARTIVAGNKVYRPVLDETVTTDDLRVAREELKETPESREVALRVLRQMLCDQNEFTPRTDDSFLMRFLRCRKSDCEKAFKTIRDYYKFRAANPRVFPAPSGIESALRCGIFNFLPHRDHKGRAVYIIKLGLYNPAKTTFEEMVAAGNLVAEYVLDNAVTQINGYIGIWDYKGFGLKHVMAFCTPRNVAMLAALMQDRFPARFKVAYCINCHSMVGSAWNVLKPMMKEKFRNRIQILGSDIKELYKYVDPSILPKEFGGFLTEYNPKEMTQRVLDREQHYNYNRKFGY